METTRIAALLRPFLPVEYELSAAQLESISTYIDILRRWNSRINLSAIREPEAMVTRHFGESLFAAAHLFPDESASTGVVDVGSGAGFPGLPLKIWAPRITLSLIEANHKKATFLREVCRVLILKSVNVSAVRAEDVPPDQADVVTLRAVERFETILPTASRLIRAGGRLALLVGERQESLVPRLTPNFRWSAPVAVPLSTRRVLLIGTRQA
jgi:16S rRNA (guanine527-N7)-methyltransferase